MKLVKPSKKKESFDNKHVYRDGEYFGVFDVVTLNDPHQSIVTCHKNINNTLSFYYEALEVAGNEFKFKSHYAR